jgi:hypothetical protein
VPLPPLPVHIPSLLFCLIVHSTATKAQQCGASGTQSQSKTGDVDRNTA